MTPVATKHAAIVGTANGLCRFKDDIRVVIEAAQFADYIWPAMEQIVEMSHEYWRTRGQFSPNVVLRLASCGYIGGGLITWTTDPVPGYPSATLPGYKATNDNWWAAWTGYTKLLSTGSSYTTTLVVAS